MSLLQLYADRFVRFSHSLQLFDDTSREGIARNDNDFKFLCDVLRRLLELCRLSELPVTETPAETLLFALEKLKADEKMEKKILSHFLQDINNRLTDELKTKMFLQLPYSRKEFFERPLKNWESTIKRFGMIASDVEEMNRCFALSRYTASMFHAMQVAELGAIELGSAIGVTDPKKGWGPTQRVLEQLVKAGRNAFPSALSVKFDFVEQMHREIETMVFAWRHKIDHAANRLAILPNTDITPDIAEHIMTSVRVFMLRLTEGMP